MAKSPQSPGRKKGESAADFIKRIAARTKKKKLETSRDKTRAAMKKMSKRISKKKADAPKGKFFKIGAEAKKANEGIQAKQDLKGALKAEAGGRYKETAAKRKKPAAEIHGADAPNRASTIKKAPAMLFKPTQLKELKAKAAKPLKKKKAPVAKKAALKRAPAKKAAAKRGKWAAKKSDSADWKATHDRTKFNP